VCGTRTTDDPFAPEVYADPARYSGPLHENDPVLEVAWA
jgi:hypothetical protein